MSLPLPWVDKIFEKLTLIYGREFVARWQSVGVEIADVKADWAHELSFYKSSPESIAYAFQQLNPSKAPTVLDFRELCRKAPKNDFKQLPQIEVNRDIAKACIDALKNRIRKQNE